MKSKILITYAFILFITVCSFAKDAKEESFFIASAIKSIPSLGEVPESEYLDIFIKFRYSSCFFSYGNVDLAFSKVTGNNNTVIDSIKTTQTKLTDAGIFVAWAPISGLPNERDLYCAIGAKLFNTIPYYGFSLGSMEMDGKLHSSYCNVGVMWRWLKTDSLLTQQLNVRSYNANVYVEFALTTPGIDILKYIRTRVGVLIPINDEKANTNDIQTRISFEVPIGKVFTF